jgi:uncharacterized membrane protein YkoI
MTRCQTPRAPAALLASCLLPLLGACAATEDAGEAQGASPLGRVPRELVELYDAARPDGVIEIELDRDGAIREMEAEVPLDSVPPAVLTSARRRYPDAEVTGAEREITKEGAGWEVKLRQRGRDMEVIFDDAGKVLEFERSMDPAEAPAAVMRAAEQAFPGMTLKSVEIVEHIGTILYHVKFERDGATYKAILTPEGRVTRRVREQRAEIEIPLSEASEQVMRLGYVHGGE